MNVSPATRIPEVVAHRGYAGRYPENTLVALTAAVEAGARFVEFDVQSSADGVPVLLHDADLRRTAGLDRRVADLPAATLRHTDVGERSRLGSTFAGVGVPTLEEAVALLAAAPGVFAFVEIKPETLERFGVATVVARVCARLAPLASRCAVISYDLDAVTRARAEGDLAVGWVLRACDDDVRAAAETLRPEFLFCDHRRLPAGETPLWPGPWRWVIYEITDAATALALAARGAALVETMAVGEMLDALDPDRDAALDGGRPGNSR